jgi:acid stress chaperone HdeB
MKKMLAIMVGATALCAIAPAAQAQVMIDMTKVTCADYSAMGPDQARDFGAWMSGWFHQKANDTTLNLAGYASNTANVIKWCGSNPKETIMGGLQRAFPTAKQGAGGAVDIDATVITCKEFVSSDVDRQMLVQAWMSGFFSATKNLSTVDLRYVNRNTQKVLGYCKKMPKATLMTAIEKNAR